MILNLGFADCVTTRAFVFRAIIGAFGGSSLIEITFRVF
jgi:hypothetical protein